MTKGERPTKAEDIQRESTQSSPSPSPSLDHIPVSDWDMTVDPQGITSMLRVDSSGLIRAKCEAGVSDGERGLIALNALLFIGLTVLVLIRRRHRP